MSAECQELNHLFSRCVDGNRIKVPKHLEDPPEPLPGSSPFILDVLREQVGAISAGHGSSSMVDLSRERLQLLLSRDDVAFSEFELLQMAMRWCTKHDQFMEDFFEYFDFSKLTDEQKVWLVAQFPAKKYIPDLVMNGLLQSSILCKDELRYFRLDHFGLRWKKIFDSSSDRLGRLMEVMGRSLEDFHRKLIVIKITNRLTVGLYVPKPLLKHQECVVDDTVRLFSFPHSQEDLVTYRRSLPTLVNYRLYFDDSGLQLYQTKRQDTWIFVNRPGTDDSSFRGIEDRGDRRRARHATVEAGLNSDLVISVALGKFSGSLARHMGRVNREPIIGAEVYVISNRDTTSMQVLDKWLEFIDTREVMSLFEKQDQIYRLADMKDVDWNSEPEYLQRIARDGDLTVLDRMGDIPLTGIRQISEPQPGIPNSSRRQRRRHNHQSQSVTGAHSPVSKRDTVPYQCSNAPQHLGTSRAESRPTTNAEHVSDVINWLLHHNQKVKLREIFSYILKAIASGSWHNQTTLLLGTMIGFLKRAPYLVVTFLDLGSWSNLPAPVQSFLNHRSLEILEAFPLVANEMQTFVIEPFRTFLTQVRHISLSAFGSLIRHICLVVCYQETALDLLMGALELESSRLLVGRPSLVNYFVANLIGIALEHIDEAKDSRAVREDELQLKFESAPGMVSSRLRIDSHSKVRFAVNDHVQLTATSLPTNSLETRPYTMDALIERAEPGKVNLQCFHPLPLYMEDCSWKAKNCGSFVTSQAMFEALDKFVTAPEEYCHIQDQLMGFGSADPSLASVAIGNRHEGIEATLANGGPLGSVASPQEAAQNWGSQGMGSPQLVTPGKSASASHSDDTTAPHELKRVDLNDSQNEALQAALSSSLTCLWGPPGTGKTHTVAVILEELLKDQERRILVTAPTHNAVDNVMRKFLDNIQKRQTWTGVALRVSTDVSTPFLALVCRSKGQDNTNCILRSAR